MVHREALFASDLQPSERPGAKAVNTAITDDPRAWYAGLHRAHGAGIRRPSRCRRHADAAGQQYGAHCVLRGRQRAASRRGAGRRSDPSPAPAVPPNGHGADRGSAPTPGAVATPCAPPPAPVGGGQRHTTAGQR